MQMPKRLQGQHPSVKRSKVQERETAKRIGGEVTRGSGNGAFDKGDVKKRKLVRIENKTTKAKSFSVTAEIIDKIEEQALMSGTLPVVEVEIDNAGKPRRVYVLPTWALDDLLQRVAP
jgi:Holliday junction resolvase